MKSIITEYENMCVICNSMENIHIHHCIEGGTSGLRQKSEDYGLKIPLCAKHHNMSNMSVHMNKEMNVMSHIIGQLAFEREMSFQGFAKDECRAKFRAEFGRSYL